MANTLKLFAVFLMCLVFGKFIWPQTHFLFRFQLAITSKNINNNVNVGAIAQDDAEVEYVEVEDSETVESFAGASQDADVVSVFPAGSKHFVMIIDFIFNIMAQF